MGHVVGLGVVKLQYLRGFKILEQVLGAFMGMMGFGVLTSVAIYAFVVEEERYNFSSTDLFKLKSSDKFPVVLDWAVGETACGEAQKNANASSYICRQNSTGYDSDNGSSY